MSKRPAECAPVDAQSKRAASIDAMPGGSSSLDVEELFYALQYSDSKLLEHVRPNLPPNAVVKFRTQFGTVHEGGLVEYAVYRVFEEARLAGRGPTVDGAHQALEVLLRVHRPGSITMELVPYLAGGAYRLVFGRDARLDDYQIGGCLRVFFMARNQMKAAEAMRALALLLIREQLVLSTTTVLQSCRVVSGLLAAGDKYLLLREAVVLSKGVDWLTLLPGLLWPETQRIPEGIHDPASDETLLDVWVDRSRVLSKLLILLHTQTPSAAVKERFTRTCAPLMQRRLDDMAVGEANVYVSCMQCHVLLYTNSALFRVARAVDKK